LGHAWTCMRGQLGLQGTGVSVMGGADFVCLVAGLPHYVQALQQVFYGFTYLVKAQCGLKLTGEPVAVTKICGGLGIEERIQLF